MAYRTAEQERWKSFDFVVGYEVKITQNGKHVEDICDCLQGKYPKTFKFTGWHPQCMCYTIPILKTEDEFFDDDEDAKSVNEVEDVPQGFKDWVKDNEERIGKAAERGKLPYFIADNKRVIENILEGGSGTNKNSKDDAEAARIEANRSEYKRLKADPNYTDVEFNPKNGGLKATHVEHEKHTKVDKKRLAFGTMTPWELEQECQEILYQNGYSCIFNSEHVFDPITRKQLKVLDTTTTGEQVALGAIPTITMNHVSFESTPEEPPVNIRNSFNFDCSFKEPEFTTGIKAIFENNQSWKDACRLADTLNDLIEEFHAPGTPRRERRAIQREFDKVFRVFRKHCQTYNIDFKFERPNN